MGEPELKAPVVGTWHPVEPLHTWLGRVGFLPRRGFTEETLAGLPKVSSAISQALPAEGRPRERREAGVGLICTDFPADSSMITVTPCSPGTTCAFGSPPPAATHVRFPLWWVEGHGTRGLHPWGQP